jgi:hypothetical protein
MKEKDIDLFYSILTWMKQNKKRPNMKSDDSIERKYANRIKDLKRGFKGKDTKTQFYPEYIKISKEMGFYSLFVE